VAPDVGPGAGRSDELEQLERPEVRTAPPAEKDDRSKLRTDRLVQIRLDAGREEPIAPVLYSRPQWNTEGKRLYRTPDLISPISPQDSACGTVQMVSSSPRCPEELRGYAIGKEVEDMDETIVPSGTVDPNKAVDNIGDVAPCHARL